LIIADVGKNTRNITMGRSQRSQNKEKLSRKEKLEMRKENEKLQDQLKTVVLPTLGVIAFLIFAYVFMKTRQIPIQAATSDD